MRQRYPAVEAVGTLIATETLRILTDEGPKRVTQPCLLALLILHLHSSNNGRGGGHSTGSVLLNTQAWDLLVEIRHDAYSWADLLGVDPKPYAQELPNRPGKPTTPAIGRLLRAVALEAETRARQPVADAITSCARRWAGAIKEILEEQREHHPIRGAACPECAATEIMEEAEDVNRRRDDDKGLFRRPAVVRASPRADDETGQPTLYCNACGWTATLGATAELIAGIRAVVVDTTHPDRHGVDDQPGQAA